MARRFVNYPAYIKLYDLTAHSTAPSRAFAIYWTGRERFRADECQYNPKAITDT